MNGYYSRMDSLNGHFNYITAREGYKSADTWALHAEEVIEKLKTMDSALNTMDGYLQAIRAALFYITNRSMAKEKDAIYDVYHKEIKKALKNKPGLPSA